MAAPSAPQTSVRRRGLFGANAGDRAFRWGTLLVASSVLALIGVLAYELTTASLPAMRQFGWRFLTTSTWDPVHRVFGALPFIYGTLVSSFLALLLAVPVSLGAALFLAELVPRWLRGPVSFLVELLAAVPSVVYGLWGIFVLVPLLRPAQAWLGQHLGFLPLFQGPPYGIGMLAGGLILAIMITPIITAVSREVLQAVPVSQREAAYALGSTRWEAIRGPVWRYARAGILGAIILGFGRAAGETMAVTMVIGNRPEISASLFSPGYTLASALANEFLEATQTLHTAALLELALILFAITIIINALARLLLWSTAQGMARGVRE
ncbi:MAG TPA: phosphate ABC transporter permease subunit PstC [Armatimonadota bacterium]|nr:phosphate ABC transporter permease subunit PstC [Armatimonadota bacterium]